MRLFDSLTEREILAVAISQEQEEAGTHEVAARRTTNAGNRQLPGGLAEEQRHHAQTAGRIAWVGLSAAESTRPNCWHS